MRSLQARMFLIFALLAAVPLIAMSALAVQEARATVRDEISASHLASATTIATLVERYVDAADARAETDAARISLAQPAASPDDGALVDAARDVRNRAATSPTPWLSARFLDANGRVLAADPPEAADAREGDEGTARAAIAAPGRALHRPVPFTGPPTLPIAVSFPRGNETLVLLVELDFEPLAATLASATRETATVTLIETNGRVLLSGNTLPLNAERAAVNGPLADALAGRAIVAEVNEDGAGAVGAFAPVPRLGWALAHVEPTNTAYASLARLTGFLIILGADILAGILLASVLVARRIVRPVGDIQRAADALQAGDLTARIETRGEDEVAQLGRAFNAMADRVSAHATDLESLVAARTREVEERSRDMEAFLYSVGHDLKAPLVSIAGYAEALAEDHGHELSTDARAHLARIQANAELMERLTQDLLVYSRLGRVREAIGPVDTDALLASIAARMHGGFADAGGRIEIHSPIPDVEGERRRIEQVFTNLIVNALKYRAPDRPPIVRVDARIEDGRAVIAVRDNGRGIPEAAHDRVFRLFQRFPVPGLEDPGGTGMGLAIVKRIAETHGGSVRFESTTGVGTTFHVALPLAGANLATEAGGGNP